MGYTLLGGLLVSITVMLAGLAYGALRGTTASGHVLPLDTVLPHLRNGDPSALLDLGILLLFATPFVAVLVALNRDEELVLHLRGAINNGVTWDELKEVLLHSAIYCGVPAANAAFAVAQRVLDEG